MGTWCSLVDDRPRTAEPRSTTNCDVKHQRPLGIRETGMQPFETFAGKSIFVNFIPPIFNVLVGLVSKKLMNWYFSSIGRKLRIRASECVDIGFRLSKISLLEEPSPESRRTALATTSPRGTPLPPR